MVFNCGRPLWQSIVSHLPQYTMDEVRAPDDQTQLADRAYGNGGGGGSGYQSRHPPPAPAVSGYRTVLGAIGRQGCQIQIHSCHSSKPSSQWNASLDLCTGQQKLKKYIDCSFSTMNAS
jgi:hypothetical protein